jgi:hypothetical protein
VFAKFVSRLVETMYENTKSFLMVVAVRLLGSFQALLNGVCLHRYRVGCYSRIVCLIVKQCF